MLGGSDKTRYCSHLIIILWLLIFISIYLFCYFFGTTKCPSALLELCLQSKVTHVKHQIQHVEPPIDFFKWTKVFCFLNCCFFYFVYNLLDECCVVVLNCADDLAEETIHAALFRWAVPGSLGCAYWLAVAQHGAEPWWTWCSCMWRIHFLVASKKQNKSTNLYTEHFQCKSQVLWSFIGRSA